MSLTLRTDPDIRDIAIVGFTALDAFEERRHPSITNSTAIAKKGQPSIPLAAFRFSCRKTNEQRRAMKTSSSWVYAAIGKNRQKPFQIDRLCEMKVASCQLCILLVLLLAPAR
jgi:hypothetical protein